MRAFASSADGMLKREWQAWTRISQGRDPVTIDLVYERFVDRPRNSRLDHYYMVFELISPDRSSRWLFLIEIEDEDTLSGELVGVAPDPDVSTLYNAWLTSMSQSATQYQGSEPGQLSSLLSEGARLYKILAANPPRSIVPVPKALRTDIDLRRILSDIRSDPRVKVRIVTNLNWELEVTTSYGDKIEASAIVYSNAAGFYCELRVLAPRLAIGRNVNFGGDVTAPGLSERSVSATRSALVTAIGDSLADEIPLLGSGYEYTDEEYEAARATSSLDSVLVGQFTLTTRDTPFRDSSSVILDNLTYGNMLGDNEILWLRLSNVNLDKHIWVIAHPSNDRMMPKELLVPDVVMVNLNCDPGASITVSIGTLPLVDATGVVIRLRGRERETEEVLDYIETMSCLNIGCTYVTTTGKYFDILRAGKMGACSLRTSNLDAHLELSRALLSLDPLSVSYEDETDEEDD